MLYVEGSTKFGSSLRLCDLLSLGARIGSVLYVEGFTEFGSSLRLCDLLSLGAH